MRASDASCIAPAAPGCFKAADADDIEVAAQRVLAKYLTEGDV